MKNTLIGIFFLLLQATAIGQGIKTYYVSNGGSDDNPGTISQPFKSINEGLRHAVAGDTVLVRTGIYREKVVFPVSGTVAKRITLKAYQGEKPVISGDSLSIAGKEALVLVKNASNITIEGLEICNYRTYTPHTDVNGLRVTSGACNVTVRNNKIHHIESYVAKENGRSGHAIEIFGDTEAPMKNILVEGNEIYECKTGYSENLTINGYVDGFIIRNNKIHHCENIGIDAAGGYWANKNPLYNYARNGIICDNELYNIDMTRGPVGEVHGHGAIGIYIDGARRITVERNYLHECDRGIGIVSENDAYPTDSCIVRNNVVANSWRTGIYLGGYLGFTGGGTANCFVVNNTLYNNNREPGAFGELEGELRLTENCTNNIIQNNLVFVNSSYTMFLHKYTTTGHNNNIDNNLYYTTKTPQWIWNSKDGKPVTDFNEWKTVSGIDANSIYGKDPQFTNAAASIFSISGTSPAKNKGRVISKEINGTTDKAGKPRIEKNKVSIGAYQ